ncbi:MAG: alpha/beta hydrolase [Deltaproteobacteria bacterium]|nr:alpha/beta hydrolase [Deltaproteobacteria bacterium]
MPVVSHDVVIPGMVRRSVPSFDGTPLSVQVVDDHPGGAQPSLLLVNGLGATVVAYRLLIERFRPYFRIACFDTRGLFASGRPVGGAPALAVSAHAKDAVAVADALGWRRFHALGWSMGVQVLLEAARILEDGGQRERLATLTLHNGVAGRAFDGLGGHPVVARALASLVPPLLSGMKAADGVVAALTARLVHRSWLVPLFVRAGLVRDSIDRPTFRAAAAGFAALDVDTFATILGHLGAHDAWPALPRIGVPTLIVAGSHDRMTPLLAMERMARALPRGELAVLQSGTHYAALEQPAQFHDALARFWQAQGVTA